MLEDKVIYALACRHRLFGYLCRILIADHRIEGCYYSETVMDILAALLRICCDAVYAVYTESVETVHHDLCRLEAALRHYRLHRIELHLSLLGRHCNTEVVSDHLV